MTNTSTNLSLDRKLGPNVSTSAGLGHHGADGAVRKTVGKGLRAGAFRSLGEERLQSRTLTHLRGAQVLDRSDLVTCYGVSRRLATRARGIPPRRR